MEISAEDLKMKIQNGDKLIVDFWASWCGPCKMMKPMFEVASKNLMNENSQVECFLLNVENNRDLVAELGIRSVPTIKGFANGKEVFSEVGVKNTATIMDLSKKLL